MIDPRHNPYSIVDDFEKRIAEWAGSRYGVAVESCTAAIFLSIMWWKEYWRGLSNVNYVVLPNKTYPSVPCSVIHSGSKVIFVDEEWNGEYELSPLNIWDSALRFKKNMYHGGFQCLSFHLKKHLAIGRGGMILTDSTDAYEWLKRARFDGRSPVPLLDDDFTMLGWNMYMTPEQAARGIELFEMLRRKHPDGMEDLKVEEQGYADLSTFPIYQQ